MNTVKLAKPVEKMETIDRIEAQYDIKFPLDIMDFLRKNSRGIPNEKEFLIDNKKYSLAGFISVSSMDRVNILWLTNQLNSEMEGKLYIPIAMDGIGNFYCVEYSAKKFKGIVFWNTGTDMIYNVCDSFSDLLKVMNISE